MPDISMCAADECPVAKYCYRYRAVPSEPYQTFITVPEDMQGTDCDHFWDLRADPPGWHEPLVPMEEIRCRP